MAVICDLVGVIDNLAFQRGVGTIGEFIGYCRIIVMGVMLQNALAQLECQVQSGEIGVSFLEKLDHSDTLAIVLESAHILQKLIKGFLAGMAKWRMTEVVGQGDRFREVLVSPQASRDRAGDIGHLERMGQSGAVVIALVVDKNLGLVFTAAES